MENSDRNALHILLEYVNKLLKRPEGAYLSVDDLPEVYQELGKSLLLLGTSVTDAVIYGNALAEGRLQDNAAFHEDNPYVGVLKTIQSNLSSLCYVADQVAKGDYHQHVDYLGDFSESFNKMITILENHRIELEQSAKTDALTGIGNRMAFNHTVNSWWNKHISFSLAFIDLDNLKYCNDHFGHSEGDKYILAVCNYIRLYCSEKEEFYRIGGDEFLILSPSSSAKELESRLEFIRGEFMKRYSTDMDYPCGFSFGCVYMDPNGPESYSRLLSIADQKMYDYKMTNKKVHEHLPMTMQAFQRRDKSGVMDSLVFETLAQTAEDHYIYICDIKENMSRWSKNAVRDFDLPSEYMKDAGSIWGQRLHPDDRDAFFADIEAIFSGKKIRHRMEYRAKLASGHYVMCTCDGYMMKDDSGKPDFFAGNIINHGIVDNVDPVTSLYNVYEFLNFYEKIKVAKSAVHVLIVGINHFATINNAYGYEAGNHILRIFGQQISNLLRGECTVYRLEGVRFAMFFRNRNETFVRNVAEKIRGIARNDITEGEKHTSFLLAEAVLYLRRADMPGTTFLSELKYALDLSKKENNGDLVCLGGFSHSETRRQIELHDAVRRSIINGFKGFYLSYQPQVDANRRLVGIEALLRWKDDLWGTISPMEYVPVLENDMTFYELGNWILETAMRECCPLMSLYPTLNLSVNISYRQLENRRFRDDVMKLISRTAFPKKNLILELTEHCSSLNLDIMKTDLEFFRSNGIHIHADDFGTGYSSMRLLKELPFDCIKVDQSFVQNMDTDKRNQILVQTTIRCAKDFGITVCIEGVETEAVFAELKNWEADTYQGYLFSRPISLSDLRQFIDTNGIR